MKQVSKHIFETIRTEVLKEQNKTQNIQERIFFKLSILLNVLGLRYNLQFDLHEEEGFQPPTNSRNRNPINHDSSSLLFIIKARVITKNLYSIITLQIIFPCNSEEVILCPIALNGIVNTHSDICLGIYSLFFTGLLYTF